MNNYDYEDITVFDIAARFSDMKVVSEFLTIHCERILKYSNEKKREYIPFVYNKKNDIFSFSFDFFIESIAKFYEPGNKKAEQEIMDLLKLRNTIDLKDKEKIKKNHIDKAHILISLFQQYYSVIFPNNRTYNVTHLKGIFTPKDSYYIPIVYENKDGIPIEYNILPAKRERLLAVGVPSELITELIVLNDKYKLKDVAFNSAQVTKYWGESNFPKLRYE